MTTNDIAPPPSQLSLLREQLDLKNREILELKEQMEKMTKEVNHFTYIVSHDLQAPLRTVTGFMELLQRRYSSQLDEAAVKFIDMSVAGAAKMRSLVFALLEYSRLNTVPLCIGPVNIPCIVATAIEELQSTYEGRVISPVITGVKEIEADSKQLTQLFRHLLDNATKFNNNSCPSITISVTKNEETITITVTDDGIGIDEKYQDKIFVMFRKLHTDEEKYPGAGAGLAICKKIAENHKGTVTVRSRPDEGSSFIISFPVEGANHL